MICFIYHFQNFLSTTLSVQIDFFFLQCSEQRGSVQILLTDNLEEVWEVNQDATHGPLPHAQIAQMKPLPSAPLSALNHQSLTSSCLSKSPIQGNGPAFKEMEWGEETILQPSNLQSQPMRKNLASSLPSLPLEFWGELDEDEELSEHQQSSPQHHPPAPPKWKVTADSPTWKPHPNASKALCQFGDTVQEHPRVPRWQCNISVSHSPVLVCSSNKNVSPPKTRHWSSWSLNRPDAVVTPHETPPDHSHLIRATVSPHSPGWSISPNSRTCSRNKMFNNASNSQLDLRSDTSKVVELDEKELTELDSLYQASLQAGRGLNQALAKPGTLLFILKVYLYIIFYYIYFIYVVSKNRQNV